MQGSVDLQFRLRLVSWILEPTSGAALSLAPLMEFARRRVPRESWAATEVRFMATAWLCGCWIPQWPSPSMQSSQGSASGVGVPISGRMCHLSDLILIACSRNVWIWSYFVFDVKQDVHVLKLELTFEYNWMEFC